MYVRLTQLSAKKSLFLVMIFAFLYYFPWLFETLQVIRIHDTLDSEVVHNKILGDFYRNGFDALKLALNNQEPLYTFRRLTQPLSLLYSVFNPFIAYMITDIAVRVIAFWGVYCLARYKSVAPFMSAIVAICFSTSISFTVFLLTIAGIPLLLYFCLKSKDLKNSNLPIYFLLSILIGCHTDLALSGIFTLCLLIPVHTLIFKEKIYFSTLVPITGFTIGLILGNIGLLYAQFLSNIVWHRVDWDLVPYQGVVFSIDTLNLIIKNTISNPWHHANFTQVIAVSSILIFFIFLKKI